MMDIPTDYGPLQLPLDEEERILMDPDTWDWDSAELGVTVEEPSIVITFTRDEYRALWTHASGQGLSTHEFIRQLALAAVGVPTP